MIPNTCRKWGSDAIRKKGRNKYGQQKYHGKSGNFYGTVQTKQAEREYKRFLVEKLPRERVAQRARARITGMSRSTIIKLLKKKAKSIKPIASFITPSLERPIREMDELWSYVKSKQYVVWIWLALERQTRKIVGIAFGDRSEETCYQLWKSLPADYRKRAVCYTDGLPSCEAILPVKRQRKVAKSSGETNHIERFNNTMRQRCANLVRKTLSQSKNEELHCTRIRILIDQYNLEVSV